jgi:hypothetical protein
MNGFHDVFLQCIHVSFCSFKSEVRAETVPAIENNDTGHLVALRCARRHVLGHYSTDLR